MWDAQISEGRHQTQSKSQQKLSGEHRHYNILFSFAKLTRKMRVSIAKSGKEVLEALEVVLNHFLYLKIKVFCEFISLQITHVRSQQLKYYRNLFINAFVQSTLFIACLYVPETIIFIHWGFSTKYNNIPTTCILND